MDVLDRQTGISLIEADRISVGPSGKVNKLLQVLSARRRRRVLRELEDEVEYLPDILREIGDVFVERAVVDGKESDLVVLERNELGEVRRSDLIQIRRGALAPRPQDQLHRHEVKIRSYRQNH